MTNYTKPTREILLYNIASWLEYNGHTKEEIKKVFIYELGISTEEAKEVMEEIKKMEAGE